MRVKRGFYLSLLNAPCRLYAKHTACPDDAIAKFICATRERGDHMKGRESFERERRRRDARSAPVRAAKCRQPTGLSGNGDRLKENAPKKPV